MACLNGQAYNATLLVHSRGSMGIAHASLVLKNPLRPELAPLAVEALADTGAMYLCIPEHVALQLGLSEQEQREVTLADGSRRMVSFLCRSGRSPVRQAALFRRRDGAGRREAPRRDPDGGYGSGHSAADSRSHGESCEPEFSLVDCEKRGAVSHRRGRLTGCSSARGASPCGAP